MWLQAVARWPWLRVSNSVKPPPPRPNREDAGHVMPEEFRSELIFSYICDV